MAVSKKYNGKLTLGIVLAVGIVAVPPAFAQSWKITRGLNIGAVQPTETRKLPDGTVYLTGGARYLVDTEDPTYPVSGQSMDCRWMCKVPVGGKDVACLTVCAGMDKDGDLFSFRGFGGNTYEVGPGTGKYSKASGGGTFESLQADDPALTAIRWKGTLNLK
jgi:hypothetical protein